MLDVLSSNPYNVDLITETQDSKWIVKDLTVS